MPPKDWLSLARDALLGPLGEAIKLSDSPMLLFGPAGVMVGTVPLMVNVIGVVVSVMPLYIIVTDGHMLSAEIGPPYLGKQ